MSSEENPASGPPDPTPLTDPPEAEEAPDPEERAQPFAVFPDADSFNSRVSRETRKKLRELGIESPEQLQHLREEHARLQEEAEKQRQAQMSELEREREARAQFEKEAQDAASSAEQSELKAYLYEVFAEKGIRNFDYALWEVVHRLEDLEPDEELDEHEFLDELMADPVKRVALGLESTKPVGANTTDSSKGPQPKPAGGGSQEPNDAFAKSQQDFKQDLQNKYGFSF